MTPPAAEVVALSALQLDLGEPPTGWASHLADRDIEIVLDDLGRLAIARDSARRLFTEKHENEARAREVAARQERAAVEADKRWRAQLSRGVSWLDMPPGVAPAAALMQAEAASRVSVREQLLEQELSRSSGLVYHPLPTSEGES